MNGAISFLIENLRMLRLRDILDIAAVAYVVYKGVKLVNETRAIQLIRGIIVLLVATQLSGWFQLNSINFILVNTMEVGVLALLVVFQPELRRALEKVGRSSISKIFDYTQSEIDDIIKEIVDATTSLKESKTGALIVFERQTKLADIIQTGVEINSNISSALLVNIFVPNTPLHDGAVIIGDNKIKAAACFLPLTQVAGLSQDIGTRHRAAIGITEVADCVSIVVSEETGRISLALNGELTRNLTPEMLYKALEKIVHPNEEKTNPAKKKFIDLVVKK